MLDKHIYQLVDGRHGRFLVNPHDIYVGKSLIAYGEWGEAEVRLFAQLLRPGDVVIEVGGNIGSHTVPISKAVDRSGIVHVFEPQRLIHQLLCANLALNDCHNVHVHLAAVGSAPGHVEMCNVPPYHQFNYGAVSVGATYGADSTMERIAMSTIDALNLPQVNFIKVDAEGYDLRVLQGAQMTIARCRPVMFVEVFERTSGDILDFLRSINYECWWYVSRSFEEQNFRSNAENIWPDPNGVLVSSDLLAVPQEQRWNVTGLISANEDFGSVRLHPDNFRTGLSVRKASPD